MLIATREDHWVGPLGPRPWARGLLATSICLAVVLDGLYLAGMLALLHPPPPLALAAGVLAGIAAADLLIGLIHWACDTWGGERGAIVRGFRTHHRAPETMLDHDWVEVNGEPAVVAVLGLVLLSPLAWSLAHAGHAFGCACLWAFVTFSAGANQLHRWAHDPTPPRAVRGLQRAGVLLAPDHHARHHRAPHTDHYCIATGWLNRPLDALGFWRWLERLVEAITGATARGDQGDA
jgi:ubiquitin-conjugating enzyme E2 variant